jgi:hypothetical protein
VTGGWRSLYSEELHNLYASPNIIRARIRWAGHIAGIGEMRNAYNNLVGKTEGKNHSKDVDTDMKIILECFWRTRVERCGMDASGGTCGGLL